MNIYFDYFHIIKWVIFMKRCIINLIIPLIVGVIVSLIMMPFMDYDELTLPFLAPPAILFPIAWTILYILMGISAYIICLNNNDKVPLIYYVQLGVNAFWSIIFFVFKLRFLAFIWIVLLIILVVKMIKQFKDINKIAAYLQIPYLLWIIFAAYLNLGIYLLN